MSNDLISRKAVIELIENCHVLEDAYCLVDYINELTVAYDVDKVVEQIESSSTDRDGIVCYVDKKPVMTKEVAIKIVKSGGIE